MSDFATYTITALTAEGTDVQDSNVRIDFLHASDASALADVHVSFPGQRHFNVPAWPAENALICSVTFSLFRPQYTGPFVPMADKPQDFPLTATRLPDMWKPVFTKFAALDPKRFDDFNRIITVSKNVAVKHGPQLGDLSACYDALDGDQQILAKMALLNLYAVLLEESDPTNGRLWIKYVNKILTIDRERFVAECTQDLWTNVNIILNNLDHYSSQGFFTESPSQHYQNIPFGYALDGNLITVKIRYEQGNVQLTLGKATYQGNTVFLLDCDMDEHARLAPHTIDLFEHIFDGGTHPIDMHEYIMADSRTNSDTGVAKIDLGYTLIPS